MNTTSLKTYRISFILFFFLLFFFKSSLIARVTFPNSLLANDNYISSPSEPPDSSCKQSDISDFLRSIHILAPYEDTNKMKECLGPFYSFAISPGYSYSSGFLGALTADISFYSDKNRNKISSINPSIFYSEYKQFWAIVNSLVYLDKPNINLVGEWKYYKYPTHTFGLGSLTDPSNSVAIDYSRILINQVATYKIFNNTYVGIGYNLDYYWNVSEARKSFIDSTYGFDTKSFSQGMSLCFLYDSRKNHNSPDKGQYCNIQYRNYFSFMGSDKPWDLLNIDLREYFRFPARSRNVVALWSYNSLILSGNPFYLELPYTASDNFNNMGRGYVQGRFRGRDMLYFESEYRYVITNSGLLGGVVFANFQSFTEYPSNTFQAIVPGYGLGLRVKFNKKSNVNVALDYGFGIKGSGGFFFNLGDMF